MSDYLLGILTIPAGLAVILILFYLIVRVWAWGQSMVHRPAARVLRPEDPPSSIMLGDSKLYRYSQPGGRNRIAAHVLAGAWAYFVQPLPGVAVVLVRLQGDRGRAIRDWSRCIQEGQIVVAQRKDAQTP